MTVAGLTRILAKISLQAELQLQGYLCVICKARFRTGRLNKLWQIVSMRHVQILPVLNLASL